MKWGRCVFLLAAAAAALQADELHLRDGTVIVGAYVGGTPKAIYFQHTAAGSDMYPVFLVESVKFNSAPSLTPGAAWHGAPMPSPPDNRAAAARLAGFRGPARGAASPAPVNLAARIKWMFALFLPPPLTVQLAHPAD